MAGDARVQRTLYQAYCLHAPVDDQGIAQPGTHIGEETAEELVGHDENEHGRPRYCLFNIRHSDNLSFVIDSRAKRVQSMWALFSINKTANLTLWGSLIPGRYFGCGRADTRY